jgi:hypothetical protein
LLQREHNENVFSDDIAVTRFLRQSQQLNLQWKSLTNRREKRPGAAWRDEREQQSRTIEGDNAASVSVLQ